VIVSHSAALAEGVRELACQMAGDGVLIAAVGGLRDEQGSPLLGTDAAAIAGAVRRVWSPAGVLLLVDMGSAVLSAELAVEMLPREQRARCLISNAPLVEGAIVAAVEASVGGTLEEINSAAESACLLPKR
jgi:dihydroxyacetone kinase phosphotransfer subunit